MAWQITRREISDKNFMIVVFMWNSLIYVYYVYLLKLEIWHYLIIILSNIVGIQINGLRT